MVARRVLVAIGFAVLVAFAPSTAWATTEPAPTTTTEPAPTTTTEPAPTTTAAAPAGTEADPLIVSLPVQWMAVFLLVGSLVVFLLAVLVVSSWGS